MAVEDALCGFDDAKIGDDQCRENHENSTGGGWKPKQRPNP
jgi:hypothetical protein